MSSGEYIKLDTGAFDKALAKKDDLISAYTKLNDDYDTCVNNLLKNWSGMGAIAFKNDAKTVKENIASTFDVIKTMCDTLEDCKAVFAECDSALGEYNRNPGATEEE